MILDVAAAIEDKLMARKSLMAVDSYTRKEDEIERYRSVVGQQLWGTQYVYI